MHCYNLCSTTGSIIVRKIFLAEFHLELKKNARNLSPIYLNGNHHVFAYADNVNLIGDDIRTIKRNAEVLLTACKDIGLAVNTGKTKYVEIGNLRDMIANEHIRIGNNSHEKEKSFKYLGSLVTNQNSI